MEKTKLIDIAENIIDIGKTIKELAKQKSYIDFHFRATQLYLLAKIVENAEKYYKVNHFKNYKKKLEDAMKFHEKMLRFHTKHYPIYINELEKYAENHGFHKGWDAMIKELQK